MTPPGPPPVRDGRRFVGRERELAELEAHLGTAIAGHGGLVLVGGEPGIGKTRLLDQLAIRAGSSGAVALWGRCWEEGGAPPYWPWVQVLRAVLRRDGVPEPAAADAHLARLVPELAAPGAPAPTAEEGDPERQRFAMFEAAGALLRAAAARRPHLVLLDDVHAADRPSLRLLGFLARALRGSAVLLVCAHREAEVRSTPGVGEALADAAREGASLALGGLPERDVARFVEIRAGVRASDDLVATLHRQTGGNPFFLEELVRLLVAEGGLERPHLRGGGLPPVPLRIHDAVDRRLAPLSPACRELLDIAAVLGLECRLGQLAAVSRIAARDLLARLDEAAGAGIMALAPGGGGQVRFRHALFREALYRDLAPERRVALHEAASRALEHDPDVASAELAHHCLEAAEGGAGVDRAVAFARRAAAEATARLAWEDAARLAERALQALASRRPPDPAAVAELLADLGEARRKAGDGDAARRAFAEALDGARRVVGARRAPLLGRIALGLAGSGPEVGRVDAAVVAVLEESLAALEAGDSPLRARLLARLAGELVYAPGDARPEALSQQAVAMAERAGDPGALGYALARRHEVLMRPGNCAERVPLASAILDLARRAGDAEMAAEGHGWRLYARLEQGDLPGIDEDLGALARLARETRNPHYLWLTAMFRAMRALLAARLDDAERLALDALALGQRHGDPNAILAYGSQLYLLRWWQGRLAEIEPVLASFAAQFASAPVWESARIHLHACAGRHEEARARLASACAAFLETPRDVAWMAHLGLLADSAALLGDRACAELLYPLLAPFAAQMIVAGPGAACFGPVARVAGLVAATCRRWDEAVAHLDFAAATSARMGALGWLAQTASDRAAVLLARGAPGDRAAARGAVAQASLLAARLDLRPVAAAAARIARLLDPDAVRQVVRREGDHWTIEFGGRACRVRDGKGMRVLARLLRHPGEELHAADLAAATEGRPAPADPGSLTLEESERHRVSVTRAVHALLDRIATLHPALAGHLARTLHTGTVCSYTPDPRLPAAWTE